MFHPQFLDLSSLPLIFFNKSSLVKILVKFWTDTQFHWLYQFRSLYGYPEIRDETGITGIN
jgi:hypothetical protein